MKRLLFIIFLSVGIGHLAASDFTQLIQQYGDNGDFSRMDSVYSLASKQINYTNEPVSALDMNVTYATYLNSQRKYDEAYQVLKRAREEAIRLKKRKIYCRHPKTNTVVGRNSNLRNSLRTMGKQQTV